MDTTGIPGSTAPARRLLTLLVALALALGGLTGLVAGPVSAQDNDAEQITQRDFDRLADAAQKSEVVFGPEDGSLELDEESVAFIDTELDVENFLVRAEFTNPYAASDAQWDYGFQFRSQSQEAFLRLILISDGTWGLTEGLEGVPATGAIDAINDGEGDANVIDLYVEDALGHFAVNGDYVATFELPVDGPGNLLLGSGYLNDSFQANAETGFAELIVWSLDEGRLGPDDETPDPDLSDRDLTRTAEAEEEETPESDLSNRDLTATAEAEDEDATATAEAEEEETPESDLSNRDLTRTAEAEDEDATATAEADEETPESDLSNRDLTRTAEADRGNAGDEPTYVSPTYGYTVSFEEPWEQTNETSEDGVDVLELETARSSLSLSGYESRDTPEECLDTILANLEDSPEVTGLEIAQDDRDRDLREDAGELSWVVVFATFEVESGDELDVTAYYECRVIVEGESLLNIVHLALSDDYNDELENRTAILDTIDVGGDPGGNDRDDRTPTEEAGDEPTDEPTDEPSDEPTEEATAESELPEGSVSFILDAVGGSDLFIFGSIQPAGRNESTVLLIAFEASGSVVTIHEGSCDNPGPATIEVGAIEETGFLDVPIDVAVEDVTNGDFVMIISTDGTADTAVACGVMEEIA